MYRYKKGFTLIEVMVAISILLGGLLALLYSVSLYMNANLQNVIRDEAILVAAEQMNAVRNTPYASILDGKFAMNRNITRNIRGFEATYTLATKVAGLASDAKTLSVQVVVSWSYKGANYQHSITSLITPGI